MHGIEDLNLVDNQQQRPQMKDEDEDEAVGGCCRASDGMPHRSQAPEMITTLPCAAAAVAATWPSSYERHCTVQDEE